MSHKYKVGTILRGSKATNDNKWYKIIERTVNSYGAISYTVVGLQDNFIYHHIEETTINYYDTAVPDILDEELFTI